MIVPMQKFHLVVGKKQKAEILHYLQERGDVEVVDVRTRKSAETPGQALELTLAELDFVLDFFKKRAITAKVSLASNVRKFLSGPREYSLQECEKIGRTFDFQKIIVQAKEIDNALVQIEVEKSKINEELNTLLPWENLGLAQRDLETQETLLVLGVIAQADLAHLKKVVNGEIYIRKVSQMGNLFYIVITYLKDSQEKFLKALNTTGFTIVNLDLEATPRQRIKQLQERVAEIAGEQRNLEAATQKLARAQSQMKIVYDYLRNQKALQDAQNLTQDTLYLTIITGWGAAASFEAMAHDLAKKDPEILIEKIEKEENERVPVVIVNQKYIEPFESVTRVYGLPEYNEMDPTASLSLFFAVFFGMCLSDAGYGLFLLVMSVLAVKFLALSKEFKRLLKLMIYCGITTIGVGILYGSYFSINLPDLPPSAVRDFLLSLQLIDPIKSPLQIMIISLLLGLLQGWFARVVNVKYLLGKRRFKDAFLGDFIWIWAILAIVFFGLAKLFFPAGAKWGAYLLIGFAVVLVLTQGYQKKNIFLKFGSGLLSLYKLVGMLSDILSYSRLLALGLTTSIIGLVINVIALLFRDMIPYAGFVIMVLVLIGGHLFNLGINVLGGFIHSARLQFVEFFPKFMEGGGRSFKPLQKEYKLIRVKSKA